jgi:hypothetical protein
MLYKLFVPLQAVGASLVYFDLFNIGNSHDMKVLSVKPVVSGATAVTGVVAVDLFLTRTTAVGTGGTEATAEGTSLTAATITAVDSSQQINLKVASARLTPTGGATAGAVLAWDSVFTEETAAGTYEQAEDLTGGVPILVKSATGIRVVQGGVASVGNIGFNVLFELTPRG